MTGKLLNGGAWTGGIPVAKPVAAGSAYAPANISAREVWDGLKQPWSSTPQGRLLIRTFSRGVMGAAFYAWGTQKVGRDMAAYNPENPQGVLQHIAHAIDKVVGKPMIATLNKVGLNGDDIVSFRPSLSGGARTLGEDAIFNTFDFAMASTGDALGRNLIGLFDPNVHKTWRGEDGKIHLPQAMKSLVKTTGKILEAQAEDWFVAIPYTFQQKFQRKLINRISPGFEYAADSTLHGSSFKLDENGKVIGTYAWEGALDLQGRFTGYNFGTAIYRDLRKNVTNKIKDIFDKDKRDSINPANITPVSLFNAGTKGIRGTARYLLNRAIKTTLVMTPSIPLFSLFRIPQGKHRGMGIMPDGTQVDLTMRDDFTPYDHTYSKLDTVLNPFGKLAKNVSAGASKITTGIARMKGADEEGIQYAENLADAYVNAAIAYTPYIYAKNEFAHHWDSPDMDSAIYKAIDGVFSGNLKMAKEGIIGVKHALKYRDAAAVEKDKAHSHDRPVHFTDKVEKRGSKDGRFSDAIERDQAADWREQVAARRNHEPEISNSR